MLRSCAGSQAAIAHLGERQTEAGSRHFFGRDILLLLSIIYIIADKIKSETVSYGVRTHAQFPAVDLKSTPLTTRAN